ncbi:MAG: amino acid aminotransferase [Nannocystaceae bacterium]
MFGTLTMAPPDAILGLTEAYNRDPNPNKINLGVGVYKSTAGDTPVLSCVKVAEQRLLERESSKGYRPITGDPRYGELVLKLAFGELHTAVINERCVTAHCPGGTGALRILADYLNRAHGAPTIWVPTPTWANHPAIFSAAGLPVKAYPYFDRARNELHWKALTEALSAIPAGDVLLLHACCHNPTGVDPTPDQWRNIAAILADRGVLPVFDFAYQGFGTGLDADAFGLRAVADRVPELVVCSSFSKNFGLYNERTGAMTLMAADKTTAQIEISHVKLAIRAGYSNPPAHGAAIVRTILEDTELRTRWEAELATMRERINGMRRLLAETLGKKRANLDAAFIMRQRGMFSMSGITKAQAHALRERFAIYLLDSGRINVAGVTPANVDRLCEGIAAVL